MINFVIYYASVIAEISLDLMGKTFDPKYSYQPINKAKFRKWKKKINDCLDRTTVDDFCKEVCANDLSFFDFQTPIPIFEATHTIMMIIYEAINREKYPTVTSYTLPSELD